MTDKEFAIHFEREKSFAATRARAEHTRWELESDIRDLSEALDKLKDDCRGTQYTHKLAEIITRVSRNQGKLLELEELVKVIELSLTADC